MENSAGIQASLAGRYASALFDLASENGTVTAVETDLDKLGAALRESDELHALTTNPQVSRGAAQKAMWGVAALLGLSELTQNFTGVLAQNRRLAQLPDIIGFEVESHALNAVGEFDHLAGLHIVEAVDAGDTVTHRQDGTDFADFGFGAEIGDLVLDDLGDFCGADFHGFSAFFMRRVRRRLSPV